MAQIIRTENISRSFQNGSQVVNALKNINISIEKESLTILRGRSGSGKTTLMNLLGALDQPNNGYVYFNNDEITRIAESKRDALRRNHIGFVFQSIALISFMSAYENVEYGLRVSGNRNAKERKKRAEECLSFVGLRNRMNHRPHELSGGEQQRVAIARAIAHRPELIFADEPTAELDTAMGLQVMKVFRSLVEREGLTVVMTTHDPNMVDLADRVITLEDGEVVNVQ